MRGVECKWPSCHKEATARGEHCSRRCSARSNAAARGLAAQTVQREQLLRLLQAGPKDEEELMEAMYGDRTPKSRYALRSVIRRGHDFFRRQGVHIITKSALAYEARAGFRLKEVPL